MKLVTSESGSKEARTSITNFLRKGFSLYTVDIALAESLSAIWKHVKLHRDLKPEDALSVVQDLTKIYDKLNILTVRELSEETVEIALTHGVTIYDSVYIAATRKIRATLYTADQKLYNSSKRVTVSKLLKI